MKILFIFGTRPEAIKMAPLIKALQADPEKFQVQICLTAQHRQMLDQVIDFFQIQPDFDLDLMRSGQTLFQITASSLLELQSILTETKPDAVMVQGDTTTAFVGALAGYYCQIPIIHLEAGLRSGNLFLPFPEEGNRKLIGNLASVHFAPTEKARKALERESIVDNVWVVGNTVVDALLQGVALIKQQGDDHYTSLFSFLDLNKRIVLITCHRRESFGGPIEEVAMALKELAERFIEVEFVYPLHLNPQVQEPVRRILSNICNIHLIDPLGYPEMIWLLNQSYLVLTDSGGIQEEAPALGKPVLVLRDVTERTEGVEAGTAKLVGTDRKIIITEAALLLTDDQAYKKMANAINPYGDGTTSQQVKELLLDYYNRQDKSCSKMVMQA